MKREVNTNKIQQKPQPSQYPLNSRNNSRKSRQVKENTSREAQKDLGQAKRGRLPEPGKSSSSGGNSQQTEVQGASSEETPKKVLRPRQRKRTRKKSCLQARKHPSTTLRDRKHIRIWLNVSSTRQIKCILPLQKKKHFWKFLLERAFCILIQGGRWWWGGNPPRYVFLCIMWR